MKAPYFAYLRGSTSMCRLLQLLFLSSLLGPFSPPLHAAPPDQVFHHGKVLTVNDRFEVVEAFAVSGDPITDVGE